MTTLLKASDALSEFAVHIVAGDCSATCAKQEDWGKNVERAVRKYPSTLLPITAQHMAAIPNGSSHG